MSQSIRRRRGQPLAVLVVLVAGWALMRALLWESPLSPAAGDGMAGAGSPAPAVLARRPPDPAADRARPVIPHVPADEWRSAARPPMWPTTGLLPRRLLVPTPRPATILRSPAPQSPLPLARPGLAGGHQLMFMAGLAQLPLPAALAAAAQPIAPMPDPPALGASNPGLPQALATAARSRWSGDGWLLLRRGSGGLSAAGQASYGASQVGGVMRYSLSPGSGHAPAAYARISRALSFSEGEAALGLSGRPLSGVPIRLLGEARVQRSGDRTRVRPAAAIVSELAPQRLPAGFTAEAYGQAGYVAGAAATPFFDGQVSVERRALVAGPLEVHLGGGAWAGGQKGAARLDIGPRATVRLGIAGAASRVALDWRFRVAGDAAPASGPALSVSAGF